MPVYKRRLEQGLARPGLSTMLAAERQQAWVRESSPLKNGRSSEGASRSEGTYFAGVFCVLLVIIGTVFFVLTKVQVCCGNVGRLEHAC